MPSVCFLKVCFLKVWDGVSSARLVCQGEESQSEFCRTAGTSTVQDHVPVRFGESRNQVGAAPAGRQADCEAHPCTTATFPRRLLKGCWRSRSGLWRLNPTVTAQRNHPCRGLEYPRIRPGETHGSGHPLHRGSPGTVRSRGPCRIAERSDRPRLCAPHPGTELGRGLFRLDRGRRRKTSEVWPRSCSTIGPSPSTDWRRKSMPRVTKTAPNGSLSDLSGELPICVPSGRAISISPPSPRTPAGEKASRDAKRNCKCSPTRSAARNKDVFPQQELHPHQIQLPTLRPLFDLGATPNRYRWRTARSDCPGREEVKSPHQCRRMDQRGRQRSAVSCLLMTEPRSRHLLTSACKPATPCRVSSS